MKITKNKIKASFLHALIDTDEIDFICTDQISI